VTAVITAKGEKIMTSTAEQREVAPGGAHAETKPNKKATAGARRAHAASMARKPRKKASPAKRVPKGEPKAAGAHDGSKTSKILDLLRRSGGASAKELLKVTGWQPHSLRGFLSGTVSKKMGLTVSSIKGEDGERSSSFRFGECATPQNKSEASDPGPASRSRAPSLLLSMIGGKNRLIKLPQSSKSAAVNVIEQSDSSKARDKAISHRFQTASRISLRSPLAAIAPAKRSQSAIESLRRALR
jgi:hypothetical protein